MLNYNHAKYDEFINSIINTRGPWNIPEGVYFESHHIVPRCMGGEGLSKSKHPNIIWLYANEHFIAHKILALENPDNYSMVYAWQKMFFMSSNQERYEPTPDEYEQCRILVAAQASIRLKKLWKTDEFKKHMSDVLKGRVFSDETRAKMSTSQRKKHLSEESKLRISIATKG